MNFFRTIVFLGILLPLIGSCNHLFYYPDQHLYATPENLGLKYQAIEIPTEDDSSLSAWIIWSQTPSQRNVIHFHGNAQNMTSHFYYVEWLAKQGFNVVTFDYRGYGRSPGKPTRAGSVQDGKAVLRWALGPQRLIEGDFFIFAQSLGGAIAIPSIIDFQNDPKMRALVLESAFSSYRGITREKLAGSWLTWLFQWPLSFLVSSDLDPIDFIAEVKLPKLFMHGTHDPVVPISESEKLFKAARPLREFWVIEQGGHTHTFATDDPTWREKLVGYFRKQARAETLKH